MKKITSTALHFLLMLGAGFAVEKPNFIFVDDLGYGDLGYGDLGLKHRQFHMLHKKKQPLSNLYVTLLKALDVPTEKFSDSTGSISEIV